MYEAIYERSNADISLVDSVIAGRYRILQILGRGGMGSVYRALDGSTNEQVALKLLPKEVSDTRPNQAALFQREYHLLIQLDHPRIIEVFDFGICEAGLYYTMELLDGNDLREATGIGWRQACFLLRDVALSLAVIHSRRLLHRDVTPRNVRCTSDGRAKLIDFGAIATMGVSNPLVGTPQFIPPEALHMQPLDQRSDLFSLGALAYWVLTGRHAYPARRIAHLKDIWRTRPRAPSELAPGIPKTLDKLVLSLLSLDVMARPSSASEVISRLNAIAQLDRIAESESLQACLVNPALVGRDGEVTALRRLVIRTVRGSGGAIMFEAAPGMGRTRLLKHLIIEAKIMGAIALNPSMKTAASLGNYGVIREIVAEIARSAPDQAAIAVLGRAPELQNLFPELSELLGGSASQPLPDDPRERRNLVHSLLKTWFLTISRSRPLIFAIDDFHLCDEPSAAVISALCREVKQSRIAIVTAVQRQTQVVAPAALRATTDASVRIQLRSLETSETEALLRSVFGKVPNLTLLTDWIQKTARGNPLQSVELARDLVDRRIIRFSDGEWILPTELAGLTLPKDIQEAFETRLASLSEEARELAELLCLLESPVILSQCVNLFDGQGETRVFRAVDELIAADILAAHGDYYSIKQQALVDAIERNMPDERRRRFHQRIGDFLCEQKERDVAKAFIDERSLSLLNLAAHHLMCASSESRATDLYVDSIRNDLTQFSAESLEIKEAPSWMAGDLELALQVCERDQRPPSDAIRLRIMLLLIANGRDVQLLHHADPLIERLRLDAGLVDAEKLDPSLDLKERIEEGIRIAQNRHQTTPENERGIDPYDAIRMLLTCTSMVSRIVGFTCDIEKAATLPAVIAALLPIHPVVSVVYEVLKGTLERLQGKLQCANKRREGVVAKLEEPEIIGLMPETLRVRIQAILMQLSGIHESTRGGEHGLRCADRLQEKMSWMVAEAWQIRMLTYLYNGNVDAAEKCRARMELAAVEDGTAADIDINLAHAQRHFAAVYAMSGDLTGLRHTIEKIASLAARYPGWTPYLHATKGAYHQQVGEFQQAREELEKALELAAPGRQSAWRNAIVTYIQTLNSLGEFERARDCALEAIDACEQHGLGSDSLYHLKTELAMTQAKLGDFTSAKRLLMDTVDQAIADGVGGLPLAVMVEARARLAIFEHDSRTFIQYANSTARCYRATENPALVTKHKRLIHEAQEIGLELTADLEGVEELAGTSSLTKDVRQRIEAELERLTDYDQRAQRALDLIIEFTKAPGGFMFAVNGENLKMVAQRGDEMPPTDLEYMLKYYVLVEGRNTTDITATASEEETGTGFCTIWKSQEGSVFQTALLFHTEEKQTRIIGAVALAIHDEVLAIPGWDFFAIIAELLVDDEFCGSSIAKVPAP
ncbi:MAG: protein kinase [Deltaproteobacteria bacterium]|nr:protein kinase [Deltaproteobacteria bacterium]